MKKEIKGWGLYLAQRARAGAGRRCLGLAAGEGSRRWSGQGRKREGEAVLAVGALQLKARDGKVCSQLAASLFAQGINRGATES